MNFSFGYCACFSLYSAAEELGHIRFLPENFRGGVSNNDNSIELTELRNRTSNISAEDEHISRDYSSTSYLGGNINYDDDGDEDEQSYGEDESRDVLQSLVGNRGGESSSKKQTARAILPSVLKYLLLGLPGY